jgi:hypothetical protein
MLEEFEKIRKDLQEYVEVRLDLIRLQTAENLAKIISDASKIVVVGYILFFILLFISMAAGYLFAELFDSYPIGFLSVALVYLIVLIIFIIFREKIVDRPIIKAILKLFFPK